MVYLMSLIMGLAVGAAYAFVNIRSPAPPIIALLGLLGIVLGEQAILLAKTHLMSPDRAAVSQSRQNRR